MTSRPGAQRQLVKNVTMDCRIGYSEQDTDTGIRQPRGARYLASLIGRTVASGLSGISISGGLPTLASEAVPVAHMGTLEFA